MLIAQLSDLHCLAAGSADWYHEANNASAGAAVASLNAESPAPACVLATGDLTNDGTPGDLDALLTVLAQLEAPLLPLPGNHDRPAELRAAFDTVPWADGGHASWSVPLGGVHLIGLDTTRAGHHGGELDAARHEWLADALGRATAPVLLALHHPPLATGIAWMDEPFLGADRLAALVAEHRTGPTRIAKIVVGHIHRPVASTFGGVSIQSGISTAVHVGLDLDPAAAPWLVADPVGYMLHWWRDDEWLTHTRYVGAATPFRPDWSDTV